jgi:hypothetical protein
LVALISWLKRHPCYGSELLGAGDRVISVAGFTAGLLVNIRGVVPYDVWLRYPHLA